MLQLNWRRRFPATGGIVGKSRKEKRKALGNWKKKRLPDYPEEEKETTPLNYEKKKERGPENFYRGEKKSIVCQ